MENNWQNRYGKRSRDKLIEARLAFVVPGKQMYLPFIGTYLTERCDAETVKLEKLQPAAQVLFFYYLYQRKPSIYISDAVEALGYSAMTISRAAKQLVQTELFDESKNGVRKILAGDSAVAKQTMVNDSMFRCYAVTGKPLAELPYAMSEETDVVVELWEYDPRLLSSDGMADPLSLMMSFEDNDEERLQMAFEELLWKNEGRAQ